MPLLHCDFGIITWKIRFRIKSHSILSEKVLLGKAVERDRSSVYTTTPLLKKSSNYGFPDPLQNVWDEVKFI